MREIYSTSKQENSEKFPKSPLGDLGVGVNMFYGALPSVFEKAKHLRENMTAAEMFLWQQLSNKQMKGIRIKPQHPIFQFIADFYCHKAKLVIEVDGGIHALPENKEYDINREIVIKKFVVEVIRFTNEEVLFNIEFVLHKISLSISERIKVLNIPFRG